MIAMKWIKMLATPRPPSLQSGPTANPSAFTLHKTNITQVYHIPSLTMHMISDKPGWPGNPDWNEVDKFNTTIAFVIVMPSLLTTSDTNRTVDCTASWMHNTLSDIPFTCTGDGAKKGEEVQFGMKPYHKPGGNGGQMRREELNYELGIGRVLPREGQLAL
ncbi:hypothetical protein J1614_004855 [Plenodomus biglobosus]|nr:hypothetical protein J1614_004855 [Plenodomus biglobosus]